MNARTVHQRRDPIALFSRSIRARDHELVAVLARALRRDPRLRDRADATLRSLSRAGDLAPEPERRVEAALQEALGACSRAT